MSAARTIVFGMPKKLTRALAVAAVAAIAVAGCAAPSSSSSQSDDRPLVLTTFTVIADMAQQVAGDDLRVESITKIGAEVHGYEPTPSDLRRAADADLVLDNGLGLEAWFEQFMHDVEAPRVLLTERIEPIDIAGTVGTANPHAWMSPATAQLYVEAMVDAFADLDPDNAADYAARAADYGGQLQELQDHLVESLAAVPEASRVLVTCEGAFSYLARDAGLNEVYLWPVNADGQGTAQQITAAIEQVRERAVPAVFCESTVSDAAMMQVVEATDAEFGGVLYVDSLSEPDGPVPTYLDLISHDIDLIVAGLTGGAS